MKRANPRNWFGIPSWFRSLRIQEKNELANKSLPTTTQISYRRSQKIQMWFLFGYFQLLAQRLFQSSYWSNWSKRLRTVNGILENEALTFSGNLVIKEANPIKGSEMVETPMGLKWWVEAPLLSIHDLVLARCGLWEETVPAWASCADVHSTWRLVSPVCLKLFRCYSCQGWIRLIIITSWITAYKQGPALITWPISRQVCTSFPIAICCSLASSIPL